MTSISTARCLLASLQAVRAAGGADLPCGVEVWHLDLQASEPLLAQAYDLLDDADRAGAARLVRPAARARHILTRATLRCLLGARLCLPPSALQFAQGPHGKPDLNPAQPLRFSVTHAADHALIALAVRREVGVDLEPMLAQRPLERLARHAFSPAEFSAFLAAPPADRLQVFYRLWACKEALIKAWALGLSAGLARFDVALARDAPPLLTRLDNPLVQPGPWILRELVAPPGHAAAVALQDPAAPGDAVDGAPSCADGCEESATSCCPVPAGMAPARDRRPCTGQAAPTCPGPAQSRACGVTRGPSQS